MTTTIETRGRRHYLIGLPYDRRHAAKDAGCRWDPEARAWWSGSLAKAEAALAAIDAPQTAPESDESDENRVVAGKAKYKGRIYFLVGKIQRGRTHWDDTVAPVQTRDGNKLLLSFRDGSKTFWADVNAVQIEKRYEKPQTIGGLKRFADDMKKGNIPTCPNCGSPSCEGVRGGLCDED